ncbi:hypothetical protein GCM10010412_071950 [Nonomuraea recticatena]|uniref:Uncharacterized protein n=1 Tax=Nonomuraea recticatena TaxID=46178 RepID=A0ABN3STI0_9ACTN
METFVMSSAATYAACDTDALAEERLAPPTSTATPVAVASSNRILFFM